MPILLSIEFNENESVFNHITRICGKALKDSRCKLNQTAQRLGLVPMYDFFPTEEGQWFELKEGLVTVQGLLTQLRREPVGVCNAEKSIADLEIIEQALTSAQSDKFRLSVKSIRES